MHKEQELIYAGNFMEKAEKNAFIKWQYSKLFPDMETEETIDLDFAWIFNATFLRMIKFLFLGSFFISLFKFFSKKIRAMFKKTPHFNPIFIWIGKESSAM